MQTVATLLAEIAGAHKRLNDKAIVDPKIELGQNVYPLLQMMAETFATVAVEHEQRVKLAEDAIAETFMQQDSMLLPEMAAVIQVTLALASSFVDDVLMLPDLPETIKAVAHKVRAAIAELGPVIDEVTIVEAEDDDELDADDDSVEAQEPQEGPHASDAA